MSPAKKKKGKRPHVIGSIKAKHIPTLKAHPEIELLPMPEAPPEPEHLPEMEEEHIVVAVPKSAWERFMVWWDGV
jgi:hypothetical protein